MFSMKFVANEIRAGTNKTLAEKSMTKHKKRRKEYGCLQTWRCSR